jgi:3-hydroxy-D-aspartate aldolase
MEKDVRRLNREIIGLAGSRSMLATPALVLDLDALEHNIGLMARLCADSGVGLRPHVKAHKSVQVARRQIDAGAVGVSCATIVEAETMGHAGMGGVHLTSPVVTRDKIARVVALNDIGDGIKVVADDADNVDAIASAAAEGSRPLDVLIDLDAGSARTGVAGCDEALALASRIRERNSLRFAGVQAYDGSTQGIEGYDERRRKVGANLERAAAIVARLRQEGLEPGIISGGGTGTHEIDRPSGLFTELQPGSYVFMDSFYSRIALHRAAGSPFRAALFVRTTVISARHDGFAITDAGLKALAPDSEVPVIARGAPPGATYAIMGDEHGRIGFASAGDRMAIGDAVECLAPYCSTTAGLYDHYCCVRGDMLVDIWPVDARGYGRWPLHGTTQPPEMAS